MIDQFKFIYYYYYYYEFYYYCGCARVCAGVHGCVCVRGYARVCMGLHRGAQYGRLCIGVHWCAQVCVKVCGCLQVCAWDEFLEYLLENRVPTSADFNTYPIRIFGFKNSISATNTNKCVRCGAYFFHLKQNSFIIFLCCLHYIFFLSS